MNTVMRPKASKSRSIGETLGSVICFVAVLGALIATDSRIGQRVTAEISTDAFHGWGDRAGTVFDAVVGVARTQSIEHAPMLVFSIVAVVLVLFMLRT
jgi:hypothetical protein